MTNKPIEVVAAILKTHKKVLIGKRMKGDSNAGKWEFPGGKIDADESPKMLCDERSRKSLDLN